MTTPNKIEFLIAENCVFSSPIIVEFYPREVEDNEYVIHYEYDFGMDDSISFSDKTCFLGINPLLSDEEIVRRIVSFDLAHAFDHPCEDPNYNHTHWALYGNLKDKLQTVNHEI